MRERPATPQPLPARRSRTRTRGLTGTCAYWSLVALVVLSLTVRPAVALFGLSDAAVNLDAVLVPFATALVTAVALLRWREQSRESRVLTVAVLALSASVALSWLLGSPRTLAGLGLGYALVLLAPLALYLAAQAASVARADTGLVVLRVLVLLQLVTGLAQYVKDDVAERAPFAADLVNGTSSHNIWPAFALPTSLVLALQDRWRLRACWPVSVAVLAVYGEAKAALLVWMPLILLVAALGYALRRIRTRRPGRPGLSTALRGVLVVMTAAVVGAGLWDSPSVQGTWDVFVGHSRDVETFATEEQPPDALPTLKDAVSDLGHEVPASPSSFLFGLGPANSVSHAAEVLAQGPANGASLPDPGPVAQRLLSDEPGLQFEDAQSSMLGVWGDLGALGALLYAGLLALASLALAARARSRTGGLLRAATVVLVVPCLLVGGVPLDWTEQANIVLPIALALALVTFRVPATVGGSPGHRAAARSAIEDPAQPLPV